MDTIIGEIKQSLVCKYYGSVMLSLVYLAWLISLFVFGFDACVKTTCSSVHSNVFYLTSWSVTSFWTPPWEQISMTWTNDVIICITRLLFEGVLLVCIHVYRVCPWDWLIEATHVPIMNPQWWQEIEESLSKTGFYTSWHKHFTHRASECHPQYGQGSAIKWLKWQVPEKWR